MKTTRSASFPLPLAVALALVLGGCAPADTQATPHALPTQATSAPPGQEVHSARPRELTPNASSADLATLADDNRAFAFDLYQAVRGQDGNLFYSPYSISLALAMTYAGARGDTEAEMAQALRFSLPPDRLHPAFNATDLALASTGEGAEAFRLSIANATWGQQDFAFEADYLDTLAVNYGAGLRLADFVDPTEREQTREDINTWVSDATEGKIEELIAEGILNDLTRLVLANAIYFKADWETPFETEVTRPAPFTLLDGSQVEAPTMARRAGTGYAAGDDYEALELYYKGDRASMVILLPAAGEFEAFEAALDAEQVAAILDQLQPVDLQILLPKFTYATTLDLAGTLGEMGMPSAFDAGAADFSGMDGRGGLYLTNVIHKAFVAVDEQGTEAAAATGVSVGASSMPQMVAVDRPFIYLIHDRQTGVVLFMGRVLNPLE